MKACETCLFFPCDFGGHVCHNWQAQPDPTTLARWKGQETPKGDIMKPSPRQPMMPGLRLGDLAPDQGERVQALFPGLAPHQGEQGSKPGHNVGPAPSCPATNQPTGHNNHSANKNSGYLTR